MLLAIDTSTSTASLSLYDGQVRWENTWSAGRRHSAQLLPQVQAGLKLLGLRPGDLLAVAAAQGPGSFTGVRVGVSVAKGLAFALDIPAFGICSLDALAAGCSVGGGLVRTLLDAGRGRFATTLYRVGPQGAERVEPISLVDLGTLAELARGGVVLCGEVWGPARDEVLRWPAKEFVLASPASSVRRAGFLAELAWQRWLAGERPRPEELRPIYVSG